ncbi:RidA family protein [Ureibacillus manganicus]|uniref:Endoribonuclease L-PSP n=1 Tax=Ureibacillus manganicus DSM 26584 TaxID=1384049 RepID=A0A0A3I2Y5_9BACL|nr:RidA family protein [Ureibacillus manganicus]KGR79186.1 endoribonuclease L-PSP [Ureibacillus manganicus DSM 26584]
MRAVTGSPRGHYSPAMISGNTVYISGQTSADPKTGMPVPGGIEAETIMALEKLETVLENAGCTKEQVVMCRVYITSANDWDSVNHVYSQFFGEHKPARAVIPILELNNGCKIELEAIAELVD